MGDGLKLFAAVLKAVKISGPAQKMYCTNLDVYLTLDLPIEDWRKVKVKVGSFDASTLPKKKAELMAYALEHGVPNVTGKMTAQAIQSKIVEHLSGADVIEETFCLPDRSEGRVPFSVLCRHCR